MKERLHYIDVTKGILILLLLVSHFGISAKWAGIDNTNPNFLGFYYLQPVYSCFFMQCFFIISGYCSNFDIAPEAFCRKIVKQLVVPWLFFEFIRIVFFVIKEGTWVIIPDNGEYTTYWFLNALIFAKLACFVVHFIDKSDKLIVILSFLFLILGITIHEYGYCNVLCIQQSLVATFFVSIGFVLKNRTEIFNKLLHYSKWVFIFIIIGRIFHLYELPVQDASINVFIPAIPLFVMTSLTGSFSLLWLCKRIDKNTVLEFYGRNTLVIYGLHMFPFTLIIMLASRVFNLCNIFHVVLFFISIYVILLLVLYILIELLSTKYTRFLVGK